MKPPIVILVSTQHPGNAGAAARGAANFGVGEAARLEDVDVPGNVSHVRVQAMAADGRQAEATRSS